MCSDKKKKIETKDETLPLDMINFMGIKGGRGSGPKKGSKRHRQIGDPLAGGIGRGGTFGYDKRGATRDETIREKYPGMREKMKEPKYGRR